MGIPLEMRPGVAFHDVDNEWHPVNGGCRRKVRDYGLALEGFMGRYPDFSGVLFAPPLTRITRRLPEATRVVVVFKLGNVLEVHSREVDTSLLLGDPTEWLSSVGTAEEVIPTETVPRDPWLAVSFGDGYACAMSGTIVVPVYSPSVILHSNGRWGAVLQRDIQPGPGGFSGFLETTHSFLRRQSHTTTIVDLSPIDKLRGFSESTLERLRAIESGALSELRASTSID